MQAFSEEKITNAVKQSEKVASQWCNENALYYSQVTMTT